MIDCEFLMVEKINGLYLQERLLNLVKDMQQIDEPTMQEEITAKAVISLILMLMWKIDECEQLSKQKEATQFRDFESHG